MIYNNRRNFGRSREQIVHEASINKLSFFIVHEPFEKGSPNPLCHTTMYLPLNNHRINHTPAVMYCGIFNEGNHARFWVNLNDGPMYTTGKTSVWWTIKLSGFQTGSSTLWRQSRP